MKPSPGTTMRPSFPGMNVVTVARLSLGRPRSDYRDRIWLSSGVPSNPSQEEKAAVFEALHAGEPFVIPNPWDAGSARVLAALGFKALASTSSGFAFTLGRLDGSVGLDEVVQHAATLDRATDLPLSVDLENGYGPDPDSVALAVERIAGAGAVGASIEDYDPAGR